MTDGNDVFSCTVMQRNLQILQSCLGLMGRKHKNCIDQIFFIHNLQSIHEAMHEAVRSRVVPQQGRADAGYIFCFYSIENRTLIAYV